MLTPLSQKGVVNHNSQPNKGGTICYTPVICVKLRNISDGFVLGRVDAGRRRNGVAIYHPMNRGFQNGSPCADCVDKAGSLAKMQPCPAAPAGDAIPLGERT